MKGDYTISTLSSKGVAMGRMHAGRMTWTRAVVSKVGPWLEDGLATYAGKGANIHVG
jgi:hypothetical protein